MDQHTFSLQDKDISRNDNLNDDEMDVTWGGKRARYMYNCILQSPHWYSNDSDETESVLSIQSKTTIEAFSETDDSSERSCGSECTCRHSDDSSITSNSIHTEYDLVSTSENSSSEENSSDYSSILDIEITNSVNDKIAPEIDEKTIPDIDDGYLPDDSDINQVKTSNIMLPPPACFKTCVKCKSENPNPYFQYCHPCFRKRMEIFEKKPTKKKKNNKKQKKVLFIENKEKDDSNNISRMIEVPETDKNLCNICFMMPRNSVFNHGKIGHIYSCYPCARRIMKKTDKCPYCNVKFKFITKVITA